MRRRSTIGAGALAGNFRVPRVAFRWPAAAVWAAVLEASAEGPELVWDDKTDAPSA